LDRAARSHSLNVRLGALSAALSVETGIAMTQEVHTHDSVKIVDVKIAHNSLEPSNIFRNAAVGSVLSYLEVHITPQCIVRVNIERFAVALLLVSW
jgi:hypothetical protein